VTVFLRFIVDRSSDRHFVMTDYYYYATAGGKRIWVRFDPVAPMNAFVADRRGDAVEEVLDHDADHPICYRPLRGLLWQ
jgi:hypothetical protein